MQVWLMQKQHNANKAPLSIMKAIVMSVLLLVNASAAQGQQNHERSITVRLYNMTSGKELFIISTFQDDQVKLVYKSKDSVSVKFVEDAELKALNHEFGSVKNKTPQNDTLVRVVWAMDSIHRAYTYYSSDSITVSLADNCAYQVLYQRMFGATDSVLQGRRRIVLDGSSLIITFRDRLGKRVVYAQAPDAKSSPLLHAFITVSLELYRQKKPDGVLNKKRTIGY
jgi:hypothetical protein